MGQFMGPNQSALNNPEFRAAAKSHERQHPFGIGKELIVDIKVNPKGTHDIYIEDMIPLMVDIPGTDNLARCVAAGQLAIHVIARPKHPDEPIPREEMEA
jgi:hypothetical protein